MVCICASPTCWKGSLMTNQALFKKEKIPKKKKKDSIWKFFEHIALSLYYWICISCPPPPPPPPPPCSYHNAVHILLYTQDFVFSFFDHPNLDLFLDISRSFQFIYLHLHMHMNACRCGYTCMHECMHVSVYAWMCTCVSVCNDSAVILVPWHSVQHSLLWHQRFSPVLRQFFSRTQNCNKLVH